MAHEGVQDIGLSGIGASEAAQPSLRATTLVSTHTCNTLVGGGETVLSGMLDQTALRGVLMRIRDLGLRLISVNRVGRNTANASTP